MSANAVRTIRPHLTPEAARYVDRDPAAVELEVAAFLEGQASGTEGPSNEEFLKLVTPSPRLPKALQRFVVAAPADSNNLSVSAAAKALEISRVTLYAWIDAKRLLAFRVTENALGIPAELILGPKKIVPGIDRVLEVIPQPSLAWEFLTEEIPNIDPAGLIRPIDALKTGKIDAVVAAAHGWGVDFT
jgi:hypothetical protein